MKISGLTQFWVVAWDGPNKIAFQMGARDKEAIAKHLKKVYDRFTVNELGDC